MREERTKGGRIAVGPDDRHTQRCEELHRFLFVSRLHLRYSSRLFRCTGHIQDIKNKNWFYLVLHKADDCQIQPDKMAALKKKSDTFFLSLSLTADLLTQLADQAEK